MTVNTTEIHRDETNWDQLTPDGMIQRIVIPYTVDQIKAGDTVLDGELPINVRHKVFAWAAIHQAELRADWELARAGLPLHKIAPLD